MDFLMRERFGRSGLSRWDQAPLAKDGLEAKFFSVWDIGSGQAVGGYLLVLLLPFNRP